MQTKTMDKNAALEWPTMILVFKVRRQIPPNFLLACWASRLAMALVIRIGILQDTIKEFQPDFKFG